MQGFGHSRDGRPGLNDSPRGESIFVTWTPKIFLEAHDGAPEHFRSINAVDLFLNGRYRHKLYQGQSRPRYIPVGQSVW